MNNNYQHSPRLLGASVIAISACSGFAFAAPDPGLIIEEVIVTAQRRDENLSETPVSVAFLSSDNLAEAQIVSEQDLRTAAPGLSVRTGLNSNQLNFSLRGQSQDPYSGTRPGVMPYLNEVQLGGSGSSAFYDLASVQVLKGPQGTLFGRSATGGAILFTSTKPTEDLSGYVSALGGNYANKKAEGAVSGSLTQGLKGRIAGFYQEGDGFQKNVFNGETEGDQERLGLRLSLAMDFSDTLSNDFMADYGDVDSENTAGVFSGLMPFTGAPGVPPFIPLGTLYGGIDNPPARDAGIATLQALTGVDQATATGAYDGFYSDPTRPTHGLSTELANAQARGPFKVNLDGPNFYRAKNLIVTNSSSFMINDNLTLKNIIGYVDLDQETATDADGTPWRISQTSDTGAIAVQTKSLSEEIQLAGVAFESRLEYVTGFYYNDETIDVLQNSTFFDILFGGQFQDYDYELSSETLAAYGQATYQLNDNGLAGTLGVRYTREEVGKVVNPDDTVRIALGDPAPAGYSYDQREVYNNISWQIGLQNQFNDELLGYVVSRRAFKAGGYNGTVPSFVGDASVAGDAYGEEQVTDLELGFKFSGDFGGMPVNSNVAIYKVITKDSQRSAFSLVSGNPASLTVNVPKGATQGAEFDIQVRPLQWLILGASLNYTDASFSSNPVSVNGDLQSYDQVTDTPETSGTIYADMEFGLNEKLVLTLHGDVYSQSESYLSPRSINSAGTIIDGYEILNLRAGVGSTNGDWTITANVKNALDEEYYAGGLPTGEIYQLNVLVPGSPRTYTLEVRYNF